jgi:hypothetical protein
MSPGGHGRDGKDRAPNARVDHPLREGLRGEVHADEVHAQQVEEKVFAHVERGMLGMYPGDLGALDIGEHQPARVRAGELLAHGKPYAFRCPDNHARVLAHDQAPMLRPPSTVTTEPVT